VTRRPWTGLALSLGLHAGLILLVLGLVSRDELPALMVDLRDAFVPGPSPLKSAKPAERPAPRPRGPRSQKSTAPVAEPAPPSGPVSPAAPPSPPPVVEAPAVPPAPPPAPPATSPPAASPTSQPSRGPAPTTGGVTAEARPSSPPASAPRDAPVPGTGGAPASGRESIGYDGAGGSGSRVASLPPAGGGAAGDVGAEYGPYLSALRQRIQQSVRYPASARRRGLAGTVSVEILIQANGAIGDVTLLESSSHAALDEAALDTIRSLPRMPLPPEVPARPLRVRVPVVFQMR